MRRRAQPWLGTLVDIDIADAMPDAERARAHDLAFQQVAIIHKLMSFHAPDSDLARINHAPVGSYVEIDTHTWTVLQAALQVSTASAGLFDVRVAACLMQWGILPGGGSRMPRYVPEQAAFQLTASGTLHKLSDDWLDLGGIAKGYAVDLAIQSLQRSGVKNACVNAGGDLRVMGDAAREIVLRDPANPSHMAYAVQVRNQALATSACYFSEVQTDRGRYSALVHGQTGEPVVGAASVTVTAPQCMFADALTKVIIASGNAQHDCLAQFGAWAHVTSPPL